MDISKPLTEYIEVLDTKPHCSKIIHNGEVKDIAALPSSGSYSTWEWSSRLSSLNPSIMIISLYEEALLTLAESDQYKQATNELNAHLRAIAVAQVDRSVCRDDLIPERVYRSLFFARESVFRQLESKLTSPTNYDLLLKAEKLTREISEKEVRLDPEKITSAKQVNLFRKRLDRIKYNIRGTITGRLTTEKDSIPILTMARKDRSFIVPSNDLFVEFDFNAAEVRTLLALSGHTQPLGDVHDFNKSRITKGPITRQETKERFFAWLYNPDATDYQLEKMYDKSVYKKFYENGCIMTTFNRKIKVEDKKALNYLIQSTSSDLTIEQAFKVRSVLQGRKSFLKALLHDSIVLDVSKQDLPVLKDVYASFKKTRFGNFAVNVKTGEDFYNMREMTWKT